ncbi:hypothetical protein [Lentzea sp. NPDC051838]|uniref:hypothetical protein n=1 Tax=Lentzea sp. NPDC051838 TaxID=3154849 RepID=UPI00342FC1AD
MVKFLYATVALQTALIFVQSVSAGLKSPVFHSAGSYTLWVVMVAHVVVALLMRRARAVWYALGFLGLTTAQVFIGIAHLTALHLPLAALLLVASALYLVSLHRSSRRHPVVAA